MTDDAVIQRKTFSELNPSDPFFNSLKQAYQEFSEWFKGKADQFAFVVFDEVGALQGFMYLKVETGPITDITPPLNSRRTLKVGTFKVEAHGTRLGERFVKKIFDYALDESVDYVYVTIFPAHEKLIKRLQDYGFLYYGSKKSNNGLEHVYVKNFNRLTGNVQLDYPIINSVDKRKWLLAIRPEYHTRLFPDSILKTENRHIVEDLSYTNSIQKIYVGWANGLKDVQAGDIIVIYRMKDGDKPAEYSAVATSFCVVEESHPREYFKCETDFIAFCQKNSVFSAKELHGYYNKTAVHVLKMTYNMALLKRPTRHILANEVGLDRNERWSVLPLSDNQFQLIAQKGHAYESIIIY